MSIENQSTTAKHSDACTASQESDLTRVAKGVKFNIESIFKDRGGFWIIENQQGFIDTLYGKPCGWENFKSSFYYEDVLREQERLAALASDATTDI